MSKFLKQQIRDSDFVGRFGGDEFVVILPSANEEVIPRICNSIQIRLKEKAYFENEIESWVSGVVQIPNSKKLNFSIGFAVYDSNHPEDVDEVIKRADEAMYVEKAKLRNDGKETR